MNDENIMYKIVGYLKNKIFAIYKENNNSYALCDNKYSNYILDGSTKNIKRLLDQKHEQYLDCISKEKHFESLKHS